MTQVGDRVELVRCTDQYTRLKPGTRGEVTFIDSTGTVHVKWDGGARLGLVEEAGDAWRVLDSVPDAREVARWTKAKLVDYIDEHGNIVWTALPPHKWRKDELVHEVLQIMREKGMDK